ncbi:MAG: hypothetical protein PHC99_10315 [Methylococcales bacterium]|nr:hypothetical protein [Methylococcales bacterium]
MKNVKRLNEKELSALNNKEKERLIIHLFDVVEDLEFKLESPLSEKINDAISHDRRKFQRLTVPSENASFCEIMLAEPNEDSTPDYKHHYTLAIDKAKRNNSRYWHNSTEINYVAFRLHDISMAGCSMVNHDEEFSYFLQPDMIYENCKIISTGQEQITISFKVMTKRLLEPYGLHKFNELIGIKFLDVKHHHHQPHSK